MKRIPIILFIFLCTFPIRLQGEDDSYYSLTSLAQKCEKAYHAGEAVILSERLKEFTEALDAEQWRNDFDKKEFTGIQYKFLSDLAYLNAEYANAVSYADSALFYSCYVQAPLFKQNIFIEKAQSQLVLRQFEAAEQSLSCALQMEIPDSTYSDCESSRALCLAYQKKFDVAFQTMKDLYACIPTVRLDSDRAMERDRRLAKIQILQLESQDNQAGDGYRLVVEEYTRYFNKRKKEIVARFSVMNSTEREGVWLTQRQFLADCYRLAEFAPGLVYNAALFNKNLLLQFSARNSKFKDCIWQDVRQGLPKNGAAIEFITYFKDKETMIAAVVVTKNAQTPVFVPIGTLENLLSHQIQGGMTVKYVIGDDSKRAKNAIYTDKWLMKAIWNDDLRRAISGCRDVFFSADSFLHQLAIEYMYPESCSPEFHRLTSTRDLCNGYSQVKVSDAQALICANIDFQAEATDVVFPGNDDLAFDNLSHKGIFLRRLEGSRKELDYLRASRAEYKDTIFSDSEATEAAFLAKVGKFNIIHISTHGFFDGKLEIPVEGLKPHLTDKSLSQSVLFFSGAGANLRNKESAKGITDGIVSARELSELDMTNVDLCVLAACQTGLGEVSYDGVYGIQRGLKNAGVKAMILSLWSIDDDATSIFISSLYKYLSEDKDVHSAFVKARKDLSKRRKKPVSKFSAGKLIHIKNEMDVTYSDPFFSNAFILIDDIKSN